MWRSGAFTMFSNLKLKALQLLVFECHLKWRLIGSVILSLLYRYCLIVSILYEWIRWSKMLPWNWRTFILQSIFRHLLFLISLLSAPFACLSAISPWGPIRLRHPQFTSMHGRRGWALSQLFLAPALDHRHSLCCMHNCLLTHAKALNQFRYSLTRFAQIKPRLHSVRWYCPCTLTSSISIK